MINHIHYNLGLHIFIKQSVPLLSKRVQVNNKSLWSYFDTIWNSCDRYLLLNIHFESWYFELYNGKPTGLVMILIWNSFRYRNMVKLKERSQPTKSFKSLCETFVSESSGHLPQVTFCLKLFKKHILTL